MHDVRVMGMAMKLRSVLPPLPTPSPAHKQQLMSPLHMTPENLLHDHRLLPLQQRTLQDAFMSKSKAKIKCSTCAMLLENIRTRSCISM
jgi:hypothetical protein